MCSRRATVASGDDVRSARKGVVRGIAIRRGYPSVAVASTRRAGVRHSLATSRSRRPWRHRHRCTYGCYAPNHESGRLAPCLLFRRPLAFTLATRPQQPVRGCPRDQADATLIGKVLIRPLHEHRDPVPEAGQIQNVNEQPRQPRQPALHFHLPDGGDGAVAADRGQIALVEVRKRRACGPTQVAE